MLPISSLAHQSFLNLVRRQGGSCFNLEPLLSVHALCLFILIDLFWIHCVVDGVLFFFFLSFFLVGVRVWSTTYLLFHGLHIFGFVYAWPMISHLDHIWWWWWVVRIYKGGKPILRCTAPNVLGTWSHHDGKDPYLVSTMISQLGFFMLVSSTGLFHVHTTAIDIWLIWISV